MKRIGDYSLHPSSINTSKEYYTIQKADWDGISSITPPLPRQFLSSPNRHITVLNFEAFYRDPNNPSNIIRSDCTEMRSNIGTTLNYDNNIICLSGRGFCGYLPYEITNLRLSEINFEFGNPLFPGLFPVYVIIQLLLEFY